MNDEDKDDHTLPNDEDAHVTADDSIDEHATSTGNQQDSIESTGVADSGKLQPIGDTTHTHDNSDNKSEARTTETKEGHPSNTCYNLQEKRTQNYDHLCPGELVDRQNIGKGTILATLGTESEGAGTLATPQMNMQQGLKMFGKKGEEAMIKEMDQLHMQKVMKPRQAKELTQNRSEKHLLISCFLKESNVGRSKAVDVLTVENSGHTLSKRTRHHQL